MPRQRRKRNRERKFLFTLESACDKQTKPLKLHRIIGLFITGLFQNLRERTKALVFVFVFVLVDEQALSSTDVSFFYCKHYIQFLDAIKKWIFIFEKRSRGMMSFFTLHFVLGMKWRNESLGNNDHAKYKSVNFSHQVLAEMHSSLFQLAFLASWKKMCRLLRLLFLRSLKRRTKFFTSDSCFISVIHCWKKKTLLAINEL